LVEYCDPEVVVKRKTFKNDNPKEKSLQSVGELKANSIWANEMINLDEAWNHSKGKGIKICIIDDGIDVNHQAFSGSKIHKGIDLLELNCDGRHIFDSEMHGAECASIACSSDENSLGVAYEASLIVIRTKGLGSELEVEAIYEAVHAGADIISCSWGP
jgi:subtilisin family serine protease